MRGILELYVVFMVASDVDFENFYFLCRSLGCGEQLPCGLEGSDGVLNRDSYTSSNWRAYRGLRVGLDTLSGLEFLARECITISFNSRWV